MALYDLIGREYATTRRPDPRIAAQITAALAGMSSVANIGAGTGSYEPPQTVVAVEPSATMIAQRPPDAAPAARGVAERLPLPSESVDAVLAVLTMHHWSSPWAGLAELCRVARDRIVILTWDVEAIARFWLLTDYLPEAAAVDRDMAIPMSSLLEKLPGAEVSPVLIPHDCTDGFGAAFWRRPEAYLDPAVRAGMSMIAKLPHKTVVPGLEQLAEDLDSGAWHREHADLLTLDEWDAGYRLVVADVNLPAARPDQ